MLMRIWRYTTIILTSLSMGLAFCHTMQLPPRMSYDVSLWVNTTHTLFPLFGTLGALIEVGSILATIALLFIVRKRRHAFRWTLVGSLCLIIALIIWFIFIAPVNAQVSQWTTETVPLNWIQLRKQWEYTHAMRFLLQFIGLSALLFSVLVETPTNSFRDRITFDSINLTRR